MKRDHTRPRVPHLDPIFEVMSQRRRRGRRRGTPTIALSHICYNTNCILNVLRNSLGNAIQSDRVSRSKDFVLDGSFDYSWRLPNYTHEHRDRSTRISAIDGRREATTQRTLSHLNKNTENNSCREIIFRRKKNRIDNICISGAI